jgi:hypothetical protein
MDGGLSDINTIVEFMKLVERAGFGRSGVQFANFVRRLKSSDDLNKELRMFYLSLIGLASTELKPGIVNLVGSKYCTFEESQKFIDTFGYGYHYKVFADDLLQFNSEFDVSNLRLISKGSLEKEELNLRGLVDGIRQLGPKIRLCNIWHMWWLYNHQEFIPEAWMKFLRLNRVRSRFIIFPGVRVCSRETQDLSLSPKILYPALRLSHDSYTIDTTLELTEKESTDELDMRLAIW